MKIKELIEKIQNQPRRNRLLILWCSTVLLMAIIVGIWFLSFHQTIEEAKSKKSSSEGFPSLFESIKKDFSVFKQVFGASIRQQINNIQIQNPAQTNETQQQQ